MLPIVDVNDPQMKLIFLINTDVTRLGVWRTIRAIKIINNYFLNFGQMCFKVTRNINRKALSRHTLAKMGKIFSSRFQWHTGRCFVYFVYKFEGLAQHYHKVTLILKYTMEKIIKRKWNSILWILQFSIDFSVFFFAVYRVIRSKWREMRYSV